MRRRLASVAPGGWRQTQAAATLLFQVRAADVVEPPDPQRRDAAGVDQVADGARGEMQYFARPRDGGIARE